VERTRKPPLLSISSADLGKADDGVGIELKLPAVTSCWPMRTDGLKLALDLDDDGKADVEVYTTDHA
jgi:hypothetical protein